MQSIATTSRQPLSLATTLAIAFFSLSAIVLLISNGLVVASYIQGQQEAISTKQHLVAQDAAQLVTSFIQDKFSTLRTTVGLTNLLVAAPSDQQQILESLIGPQPAFQQLVVLDIQGNEISHSSRTSLFAAGQLPAQTRQAIIATVQSSKTYISPVYIDPNNSEPLVLIAVPVITALGDMQGSLVAEVRLKYMWDLVDSIKVGTTGYAYVVDRQGTLIAFRDTARVLRGENVSQVAVVNTFVTQANSSDVTTISSYTGITGATVFGTQVPLMTPDWAVVTELPIDEAYRDLNRQLLLSIGIILAVAFLAGLIGIILARRLAVPLVSLTAAATRITAGETNLQAHVGGAREIASLATAFNSMTAQLYQTLTGLEQRVNERTGALQQALAEVERRSHEQELLLAQNDQQRETIREMSVPILPVMHSTLVMPLIGVLDTERLRLIQAEALQTIERSPVSTLILDITGIQLVDSQIAQGLMIVVQAAGLLGTEVVLVGVRPEVAQTIVGLGLNLGGLHTYSDLASALAHQARKAAAVRDSQQRST